MNRAEPEQNDETVQLRRQIIDKEVEYALSNPLEKDELEKLYKAYYQDWSKESLTLQIRQMK